MLRNILQSLKTEIGSPYDEPSNVILGQEVERSSNMMLHIYSVLM